jgi:hypothetical protein
MMDESAVVPKGSHFCRPSTVDGFKPITWNNRCKVAPVQYYYIDFSLSTKHKSGLGSAAVLRNCGQVKTLPESSDTVPYNPFKADIYLLGYTMQEIIQVSDGVCFIGLQFIWLVSPMQPLKCFSHCVKK